MVYYIQMAQPKTAPLSVRLGEARLARVDAFASEAGLARHAAILRLVDLGLLPRPSLVAMMDRTLLSRPEPEKIKPQKVAYGSRLKKR
jgi:hypothetical protein